MASSLFHGVTVDLDRTPSNHGLNSMVLPNGFPRPPDSLAVLCCPRLGPLIDAWNGPHPDVQDLTSGLSSGSVFVAPDLWDSQTSPPDQFPSAHVTTIPICLWCWIVTCMSVGCGVPGVK